MFTHRHNGAVGWAVRALVALLAVPTTTVGVSILTHAAPAWAATGLGTGTSFCSSNGGLSSSGRNLDNVYPCANRNINDSFGYQCVEFSARFESVEYGVSPSEDTGPGWNVVNELHNNGIGASSPNGTSSGSSAGSNLPAVGDVMSMWGPYGDSLGHTGVVSSVNVANGSGTITYLDENGSLNSSKTDIGYDTITVSPSGWSDNMGSGYDYTVFNWTTQSSADLDFIKTADTGSGHIEVHVASASSAYQSSGLDVASYFNGADANNGAWQMVNGDLYFAKTQNTGSGHVEVHTATAGSGYQNGSHFVTYFSPSDSHNGAWQFVNGDLYFIKAHNTGSGHIEVHSATAAAGYQSGVHIAAYFSEADANNGWWQISNGSDLYFIKLINTGSGHIEVHSATAAAGYQSGVHYATRFSSADAHNGWWVMYGPDLYFIKTHNTGSGMIEVHSATAASGYQSGIDLVTRYSEADANNGWFQIGNKD